MKIIIFLYALLLGSFFNVVGLRVPMKQSIIRPRSACPNCSHNLTYKELIPVLSYIMQFGKCKQCGKRISPLYPIMEISTACLFVFAYTKIGWNAELIIAWTLISLLVIIFVSDISYMLIPDKILLAYAGVFLIERAFIPLTPWWDSLAGAAVGFIMLFAIAVISKGGMGGGDIKLYALLGFVLGMKFVLVSFFFANLIGAVIGLAGLVVGVFERKKPIPFGPFITVGTLIVYFFHEDIFALYYSLFTY